MTRKRKRLVNLLKVLPILLLQAYHMMGYTEKGKDISHHNIRFSKQAGRICANRDTAFAI